MHGYAWGVWGMLTVYGGGGRGQCYYINKGVFFWRVDGGRRQWGVYERWVYDMGMHIGQGCAWLYKRGGGAIEWGGLQARLFST